MEQKPRFLQLIGLPASGKSTFALELVEGRDDIVYLSSDKLREELLGDVNSQEKNGDIFHEMTQRTRQALKEGKHVIYDATNVSRKKRRGLLQQLPKDVEKVACYMSTEYDVVVEQNNNRERVVPQHVIDRMYKTLQLPIYSEGWNKIVYHYHDNIVNNQYPKQFTDAVRAEALFNRDGYGFMEFLALYFDEFFGVYELPQHSKWHKHTASEHIYRVYRYILENYKASITREYEIMLWAGLLHDVGKAFCKSFVNRKGETKEYANFIGHEYVGAQMATYFLHKMNFDDRFIYEVSTLVQFHMYLLDERASRDKLKERVGEETYRKLEFLREADTQSH